MKLTKRTGAVLASAGAVAALGLGGVAIAASGDDGRASAFAEALSEQTGAEITAEDVTAAGQEVAKDRVERAVADGALSREQADRIIERIESGELPGRGPRGGHGVGHHGPPGFGLRGGPGGGPGAEVAEALGLDPDAVREARRDGQSLAEYAESQGTSRAEVIAAIKEAISDAAAERGVTPPDDEALDALAERIADREGGRHHGHHPHSPWGESPEQQSDDGDEGAGASRS
jgi:hypothetical protein